jgi:hypothetical protein
MLTEIVGINVGPDEGELWFLLNSGVETRPVIAGIEFVPDVIIPPTYNTWGFLGFYQASPKSSGGVGLIFHPTSRGINYDQFTPSISVIDPSVLVRVGPAGPDVDFWGIAAMIHRWMPTGRLNLWADI